jgi:hypothetical protein
MLTVTACAIQPRHAHAVALFDVLVCARAFLYDKSAPFMSRDEWWVRLYRPVAIRRVYIRVADSTGLNLDKHLALFGLGYFHILYLQRLTKFMNDGSLHTLSHIVLLCAWALHSFTHAAGIEITAAYKHNGRELLRHELSSPRH